MTSTPTKVPEWRKCVVSEEEYQDAAEDYMGWCTECKDFTRDSTEPDATGYDCPMCGKNKVMGAENAVLMQEIIIE